MKPTHWRRVRVEKVEGEEERAEPHGRVEWSRVMEELGWC